MGQHIELQLPLSGRKSFVIEIEKQTSLALFTQHTAEEFNLRLAVSNNADATLQSSNDSTESSNILAGLLPVLERTWVAQHEHDDEVSSVAIEADGDVNANKLNAWLAKLLREKGVDIFRMKGFISIAGESQRFVFQGVHMLFDGQPERPWGNDPRHNQLVFIGRNLEGDTMKREFEACLN